MRNLLVTIATIAAVSISAGVVQAAPTKRHPPVVLRSARGTIIQPTRTIIHHADGTTTIITVPRRSYLDTGTSVSIGDRKFLDYAFPPDGDPGRPYWYFGPDLNGVGGVPLAQPFLLPGFNSNY